MIPTRPRSLRFASILFGLALTLMATAVAVAGDAPTTTVEGGAYRDFVAPDAGTLTPGSIAFGFTGPVEVIAADAELVPPADTNLEFLGGGTPTCLEVTRAGGEITRLAFVAECLVSGEVVLVEDVFGPDLDGYLIAGRLIAPAEFLDAVPEFQALIGLPAGAGTILSITFSVDPDVGIPGSFVGVTSATGPVALLPEGDVHVAGAPLPAEVIDDASRTALMEAADLGVEATVEVTGYGNLQVKSDVPELEIVLAVTYSAPPETAAPTPTASPGGGLLPDTSVSGASPAWAGLLALAALAFLVAVASFVRVGVASRRR